MSLVAKITSIIFSRKADRNDLAAYPNWRVGLSAAASWSWGVSLAVGMSIMHTKGIIPFFIWTLGNVLAIPLFGLVRTYLPFAKEWANFLPFIGLFLFMEYFAVILNLQGMLSGLGGGVDISSFAFMPRSVAIFMVLVIGLFIAWYINRGGLRFSVLTDIAQYTVQVIGVVLLVVLGFFIGGLNESIHYIEPGGIEWAKIGFLGIITGVLGTGHQWQRFSAIKEKNILKTSLWGGAFFAVYMCFVGLAGLFFVQNIVLGTIFLVTMLALASSSIDSAMAGLEYITQKFRLKGYWASLAAVLFVLSWPFMLKSGMTELWTFMAKIRLAVVIGLILISIIMLAPWADKLFKAIFRKLKLFVN